MADPFQAVQSMFGSVGRWLGTKENEYWSYKRYGPQWKEILAEKEQQRVFDAVKDIEDIENVRARTALTQEQLKGEEHQTEQEQYETAMEKAKFLDLSEGMEVGTSRREAEPLEEGPGFKEVTATQVAGRNIGKYGGLSEFKRGVETMEQDRAERESVSRISENEAQAGASDALRDKRRHEMTDEFFEQSEKYKAGGVTSKKDGRTAAHRNAILLSKANELALEGYYGVAPEDLPAEIRGVLYEEEGWPWSRTYKKRPVLDPFKLEENKINFSALSRVPSDLLEEAGKIVQQDLDGHVKDSEPDPDAGGGIDERPKSEKFRAGQGESFERDTKVEASIRRKKQEGNDLTADEEQYLQRLMQSRGTK